MQYKVLEGKDSDGETPDVSAADPSFAPTVEKLQLRQLFRAVLLVSASFFRDRRSKWKAWGLASALVVTMVVFSVQSMLFLSTLREFQNALHDKDQDRFYAAQLKIVKVVFLIMPVIGMRFLLRGTLSLEWRRYLTQMLLSRYINEKKLYYRLKLLGRGLDNPDQRIAQDTGEFTDVLLEFVTTVAQQVLLILVQSGILISISRDLFYFIVLYSLILNVLSFAIFGGPFTRLRRRVLAQEASFRFTLVRVREHAEPVAFFDGHHFELQRCEEIFAKLMGTLYRLLAISISFGMIEAAAMYVANVAPFVVLAGKYFSGSMDFGGMMEAATVLGALQAAFTTLVTQMDAITNMGAQAIRIQQLWDMLDETDMDDTGIKTEIRNGERRDAETEVLLQLDELTIFTPKGHRPLVEQITLQVKAGEALMLCGPSGVGKSSLLRSIAGLWHRGSGRIHRCAQKEMFFLPQETYLCLGSLRENATYPKAQGSDGPSDREIREALEKVNLSYLVQRFGLDVAIDFDSCLSGGERQRLGFARLLLKRPTFAILDEATSALDCSNQEAMYSNLKRHVRGYVSVGHSASLEAFHTMKLILERTSSSARWRLERLET